MLNLLSFLCLFVSTQILLTDAVCKRGYVYKRHFDTKVNSTLFDGGFIAHFTATDQKHCENECFWAKKDNCYKYNYNSVSKLCGLMYRSVTGKYRILNSINSVIGIRKCGNRDCHKSTQCFLLGYSDTTCLCPPPLNISSCTPDGWLKVNDETVCFGAKNDSFGKIVIPYDGVLSGLKLKHVSGGVRTKDLNPEGFWGTAGSRENNIEITVTDHENATVTPPATYTRNLVDKTYAIKGFTTMSPEIQLPEFTWKVVNRRQLRLWVIEDLDNIEESDNSGITCADVYFKYDK